MRAVHDMWSELAAPPPLGRTARLAARIGRVFNAFPWVSVRIAALVTVVATVLGLCSQLIRS
jgi:hypothetical protein